MTPASCASLTLQPLEKQGAKVGMTFWVESRLDCTDGIFEEGSVAMVVSTIAHDLLPIKPPPELVNIRSKMLPACPDRDLGDAGGLVWVGGWSKLGCGMGQPALWVGWWVKGYAGAAIVDRVLGSSPALRLAGFLSTKF